MSLLPYQGITSRVPAGAHKLQRLAEVRMLAEEGQSKIIPLLGKKNMLPHSLEVWKGGSIHKGAE